MDEKEIQESLYREFNTLAGRNRTLYLTLEDRERYRDFPGLEALSSTSHIEPLLDTLYLCDCLPAMRTLPDQCVHLVFADPPYNLGKDFGNNKLRTSEEAYEAWTETWVREAHRLLVAQGSIYVCADWRDSRVIQTALERFFTVRNRITWGREKGRGSKRNWKNNLEDIWFATKSEDYVFNVDAVMVKKPVIAPYRENGMPKDWFVDEQDGKPYRWTHPSNLWTDTVVPFWSMPENTPHPTQKPEQVVERVILASSNPGDVVLDPFMGSGTTAVVARRLSRRYIGFEINEEYVRLAMKRLDVQQQLKLF